MDERVLGYKVGAPVPEWDLRHRLPIDRPVSSECKDTGTVYRINSTYMDVSDQPNMRRQLAAGVLGACFGAGSLAWSQFQVLGRANANFDLIVWLMIFAVTSFAVGFGVIAFRVGRDEFFALKRRPIRFSRTEQRIYAIRRRRFFNRPDAGDVTFEAPWAPDEIFCIHRSDTAGGDIYHIRHYSLDNEGKVVRAFSIGREWRGREDLEDLLSQWNYWCWYMNHGPAELPKPALFLSESETALESFLYCMYDFGFRASSTERLVMMPFILLMTAFRLLALWTCREPVWPSSVEAVSGIDSADPYCSTGSGEPVGWAQTSLARERGDYPDNPRMKIDAWDGEPDGAKNAELWAAEAAPPLSPHRILTT